LESAFADLERGGNPAFFAEFASLRQDRNVKDRSTMLWESQMHVSDHLYRFPLQASAVTSAQAPTKKPRNLEEVPPVESRFSEDEQQEERRRQPKNWLHESLQKPDEEGGPETTEAREEPQNPPASGDAVQAASPLDSLLAGIMREAPASDVPESYDETHETAAKRSLDELLAAMRAAPEKP
jgi:hypothetical protein